MTNVPIKTISVGCTGTPEDQPVTRDDVVALHKAEGSDDIDVHWLITPGGMMIPGLQEGQVGAAGAGVVSVVYIGGADKNGKAKDTRTDDQKAALACKTDELLVRYPDAVIEGMVVDAKTPTPVPVAPIAPVIAPVITPVDEPPVDTKQ